MNKPIFISALMTALLITSGCSEFNNRIVKPTQMSTSSSNLVSASADAADVLAKPASDVNIESKPVTIVTTFVNSENFLNSSALGRTVSEQIAGRLAQLGFPVREIRLRGDILVKGNQGELILSRELKEVAKEHEAATVVVGTYTEGAKNVFVSTKMVRLEDNRVISAHNFSLNKDHDIATLLHGVRSQDLYPKEDEESEEDFGSGDGNSTLMDAIREYDKKINETRKNKGAY